MRGREKKNTEFTKQREIEDLEKRDKRLEDLEKRVKRLEDEQRRLTSQITESEQVTKKGTMIDSPIPECITSARLMSAIDVPGSGWIDHIANVKIGRLWVSDYDKILKEVNFQNVIQTVTDASCSFGKFDVTSEGFLLYVRRENIGCSIQKMTPGGKNVIMFTSDSNMIMCIHSSKINMDLIVCVHNKTNNSVQLARYGSTGETIRDIAVDGLGQELYKYPIYVTENRNGDVVVSDKEKKALVVVDSFGGYRFDYSGYHSQLSPGGICTDVYRHILVADCHFNNSSIHILDQDGQFLLVLLSTQECKNIQFLALCVDDKNNLYVGDEGKQIKVYKYLKD